MRKLLWLFLALPLAAFSQISNPSVQYVSVAPSGACSASPPVQVVNSTGAMYTCNNGTWGTIGGGGTGAPADFTVVLNVASPTFAATSNTSDSFFLNSTFNVSTSNLSGASVGELLAFTVCPNAHTFNWPASFVNFPNISGSGTCTTQSGYYDGTNVNATPFPSGGGGSGTQWQRIGVTIAPISTDPKDSGAGHIQEVSSLVNATPELLTTYSKVKLYSFTDGWWPVSGGGSGMSVCFGESADDISQPTRFPNCIANHGRSTLTIDPTNGKYMLAAPAVLTGHLDIYEATTIAALSSLVSPTYADVLDCGSNGNETAGTLGSAVFIYDSLHSLWRVIYGCVNSSGSGSYASWMATGSVLNSLAKFQTSPVLGYGSGVNMGGNCNDCGISQMFYQGGKLYGYAAGGPTGVIPTPYFYRVIDSTGIGNAWVPDANPFMQSKTSLEGLNFSQGQIGSPFLSPTLDGTGTVVNYGAYLNGCSGQTTCIYPSYIMAATISQPLATVLTEVTTDALPTNPTQFLVNGIPASCGAVCNIAGAGVTDSGNGTITIATASPGTGSYVQGGGGITVSSVSTKTQTIGTVAAGDLVVGCVNWDYFGTPITLTSISDGTSNFTTSTLVAFQHTADGDYENTQCGYLLAANSGALTYTATLSGTATNFLEFWIAEFHATSGTWHYLGGAQGHSDGTTPSTASATGTFSPATTATVSVMDTKLSYVGSTQSTPLIGGFAATSFASWSPVNTYDYKYYVLNQTLPAGSTGNTTYAIATFWLNAVMAFGAY